MFHDDLAEVSTTMNLLGHNYADLVPLECHVDLFRGDCPIDITMLTWFPENSMLTWLGISGPQK